MRKIVSKFPGRCEGCGKPYQKGDEIFHAPGRARHLHCGDQTHTYVLSCPVTGEVYETIEGGLAKAVTNAVHMDHPQIVLSEFIDGEHYPLKLIRHLGYPTLPSNVAPQVPRGPIISA